jgi:hypothetical protein
MRKIDAGSPMSELRLPGFLTVGRDAPTIAASNSFVLVLPAEPVTPKRRMEGKRERQAVAALWSAARVSGTTMTAAVEPAKADRPAPDHHEAETRTARDPESAALRA